MAVSVDAAASGIGTVVESQDIKFSVRAATTANITLSGAQAIDGVAVVAGDRVLVKNQTTGSQNGVYVAASGSWTRAVDADIDDEITAGLFAFVEEGTANADTGWLLTTNAPIVVGTTALTFAQFSGPNFGAPTGAQYLALALDAALTAERVFTPSGGLTAVDGGANGTYTLSVDASAIAAGTLAVARGGTGTGTAFTAGSVVFAGAGGTYAQDNANLFWDDTNNRLGIGTTTPAAILHLVVPSGTLDNIVIDVASATATHRPSFIGRRARGTVATPAAVATGDILTEFTSQAYDGAVYRGVSTIRLNLETFTAANNLSGNIMFFTRPTGVGENEAERVRIVAAGTVIIGTPFTAGTELLLVNGAGVVTGDLRVASGTGVFQMGGVTLFENDRDFAVAPLPNVDAGLSNGSTTRRWSAFHGDSLQIRTIGGEANAEVFIDGDGTGGGRIQFGPGGATALNTTLEQTAAATLALSTSNATFIIGSTTANTSATLFLRGDAGPDGFKAVYSGVDNQFALRAHDTGVDQTPTILIDRASGQVGINFALGTALSGLAKFNIAGALATQAANLALVNGANNDIAIGDRSFIRITGPTAAFNVTGIASGVNGKILYFYNTTAQAMTLNNENVGSVAANRVRTMDGADRVTVGEGIFELIYDATLSRWLLVGQEL